ncbi:BQ5605_C122g13307 [Microbotryum silenes-dioicae]|uniref:BQ5605_C122g13307 protein n=1 Tax=Microbotryum silenes-dioicae TaxID=796604 RepID=A0A2X0M141_9BASI|nr:BQ5605_C122g13307 [Microbotryum silenes-dioicae]
MRSSEVRSAVERHKVAAVERYAVSDQDEIVNAVAAANFCTKIDLQGTSQQIRIKDEDVKNTAFSTPNGILYLLVAQQGDRNSTATLHRLVSFAFVRLYNRKIKHYADDLWPISNTKKIRLGESSMQPEKAAGIRATPAPKYKKDLQRFLGAMGYNHRSTPHLAELAAPLDALTGVNSPWRWSRACSDAFETIKAAFDDSAKLTCIRSDELAPDGTFPVPLDTPPSEGEKVLENESKGKYLFLQIGASVTGVGYVLSIGTNWWTAIPTGYHSRKFSPSQFNYNTQDQELQGMYEGFKRFET